MDEDQNTSCKVTIKSADLPVTCPLEGDEVWRMHPKVTVPLDRTNRYVCPYCSRIFELDDQ